MKSLLWNLNGAKDEADRLGENKCQRLRFMDLGSFLQHSMSFYALYTHSSSLSSPSLHRHFSDFPFLMKMTVNLHAIDY